AIRTVFNALGPIANPARATHQVIGTYDNALRPMLATALATLGIRRAWIVRGADGLDEVSPFGPTRVTEIWNGAIRELTLTPRDFGIGASPAGAIAGGDAGFNARRIEAMLRSGAATEPAIDAVAMNAAAA